MYSEKLSLSLSVGPAVQARAKDSYLGQDVSRESAGLERDGERERDKERER